MLSELHVRNLALIERADIEFDRGLTILTGETGAGKSILLDSLNLALGAKFSRDMIRTGAQNAHVELVFVIDSEKKREELRELEVEIGEDALLIITRKLSEQRSVIRVNDETVTLSKLKKITALLIDIHGQHEHQSLLLPAQHLRIVDAYGARELVGIKEELGKVYAEYAPIARLLSENSDEQMRLRETEILNYEIEEIEQAQIKAGEEAELAAEYKRFKNASKIKEALHLALASMDLPDLSEAEKRLRDALVYDESLADLEKQICDIEDLLLETRKSIYRHLDGFEFDEEKFSIMEERLAQIRHILSKFNTDDQKIAEVLQKKIERMEYLENYASQKQAALEKKSILEEQMEELCTKLTGKRREVAERLCASIREQLLDLNFLGVEFSAAFEELSAFSASGKDSIIFMISTNPGEPQKPLRDVASGGELSRIMLAIKTVLAGEDDIGTMIFDEVDTGISGRTAAKVAQKLNIISAQKQVICITHLPQIAAMADRNFVISKTTDGFSTRTDIEEVEGDMLLEELVRLLGSQEITEAARNSAREMKEAAQNMKKSRILP